MTLLTIKMKHHGETVEAHADADAVLAAEWARDNKSNIRNGDAAVSDFAYIERDANIGDARRLTQGAALAMLQRTSTSWRDRAANNKLAARFIRSTR